jgi:hypothetical protein
LLDERFGFNVQVLRLFDDWSCFIEKIDQPLGRGQRFLDLFKLCVTKTGNVAEASVPTWSNLARTKSHYQGAVSLSDARGRGKVETLWGLLPVALPVTAVLSVPNAASRRALNRPTEATESFGNRDAGQALANQNPSSTILPRAVPVSRQHHPDQGCRE